jgi:hypothetical protein
MTVVCVSSVNGAARFAPTPTTAQCVLVAFTFMMDGATWPVQLTPSPILIRHTKDIDAETALPSGPTASNVQTSPARDAVWVIS